MKHTLLYIISVVLVAVFGASCATHRTGQHILVTPSPYEVRPDSSRLAIVELELNVPPRYFSRRSRIIVIPELIAEDSTFAGQLKPVVLDGSIFHKKNLRRKALEGYVDPYADYALRTDRSKPLRLPYRDTIRLSEDYERGRIEATVSHDGCGSCTGIDRIQLATVDAPRIEPAIVEDVATSETVLKPLGLTWMEPAFVVREKLMQGQGTAHLQFIINKYDIVPELGNNHEGLEQMVSRLEPILNDTLATITKITIYGMASADGPLSFNTPLSANRAKSAKQWLAERLLLPEEITSRIQTGSRPEGWQPVLEAMTRAGNPDSLKLKDILVRYADQNDDVQERYIRRLACWPTIRDNYLQKDRKVDYTYAWVIRSFTTDAELLANYRTRPDAFNEEELLRVAQLAADDNSRMQVYRYTLRRFPQSQVARNNLAILLERSGRIEEAYKLLGKPTE